MARFVQFADLDEKELVSRIREGAILLYPTDTVYSIGCDIFNERAVRLVKSISGLSRPLGIVVPSKFWLKKHFILPEAFLEKLPGPFTFVVAPRETDVCPQLSFRGTYRVRYPNHSFTDVLARAKISLVDATLDGRGLIDVAQVPSEVLAMVDIVVVDGIRGRPLSSLIDVTSSVPLLVSR